MEFMETEAWRDALPACRQCRGDLIGVPGEEVCGTCGLPLHDPAAPPAEPAVIVDGERLSDAVEKSRRRRNRPLQAPAPKGKR